MAIIGLSIKLVDDPLLDKLLMFLLAPILGLFVVIALFQIGSWYYTYWRTPPEMVEHSLLHPDQEKEYHRGEFISKASLVIGAIIAFWLVGSGIIWGVMRFFLK